MESAPTPGDPATGLFVGPLHQGKKTSAKRTAKNIFRLMLSVGVLSQDIVKVVVDPEEGFALVHLHSKEAEDFLLRACKDVRDVLNFFDLRLLTANPKHFKVIRRGAPRFSQQPWEAANPREEVNRQASNIPLAPSVAASPSHTIEARQGQADNSPPPLGRELEDEEARARKKSALSETVDENTWTKTTDSSPSASQHEFEQLEEEATFPVLLHASTSTSATIAGNTTATTTLPSPPVLKVDVKTSTPHVSPCFCPETVFYHKKQHVGSEDRHVEFKRGGNLSDLRIFRSMVGKYMCAFLNTEGGTIFFGVTDDGKVVGVEADQKTEDTIRLTIDNAVSGIKPPVSTSAYTVNFAKVMDEKGSIAEDVKVLEVCVKPREPPRQKFVFNDVAYVRRDGSLRTL